jgi:hypothetical protein
MKGRPCLCLHYRLLNLNIELECFCEKSGRNIYKKDDYTQRLNTVKDAYTADFI